MDDAARGGRDEGFSYFDVVDIDVPLPGEVPGFLEYLISKCEGFALMGDEEYYEWADHLDVTCKNAYTAGEITREEWDLYTRRYHLR